MKRYATLIIVLALCACNTGGGGGDGYRLPPRPNPGESEPVNPVNPANPDNYRTLAMESTPAYGDVFRDGESGEVIHKVPQLFLKGYIDTKKDIFYTEAFSSFNALYTKLCKNENGCDVFFENGENYYVDDGSSIWKPMVCTNPDGCTYHANNGEWFQEYCRDTAGCLIEDSGLILDMKQFKNGKYTDAQSGDNFKFSRTVALGSQDAKVPLRFSEFGYWIDTEENSDLDISMITHNAFYAGDSGKEVDMKTLATLDKIQEKQSYSGQAYVGVVPTSTGPGEHNAENGFLASGTATLEFDPTADKKSPKETLGMSFSDAGWYNVQMNGDGSNVIFWGNPQVDNRFQIATRPTDADSIDIHYYGEDTTKTATEAVGTASFGAVKMQDGDIRDINFSFGVTKD